MNEHQEANATRAQSAIERAKAYGIDVTLLESRLRLSVSERLRDLEVLARFAEDVRTAGKRAFEGFSVHDSKSSYSPDSNRTQR
jgi:hypothetical protein